MGVRLSFGVRLEEIPTAKQSERAQPVEKTVPAPDRAPVSRPAPPAAAAPAPRPRPAPAPASRRARPAQQSRLSMTVLLVVVAFLLLVNLVGLDYFLAPIAEKVRHAQHAWFKPSGHVGQAAGVAAFVLFVFMYLYPLRKRLQRYRFLGPLPTWLRWHIVAGLVIPVVGGLHAGWRFQGLIGLGYGAMVMVSASGVVGRYLYVHLPHSRSGLEMSLGEIESERSALCKRIAQAAGTEVDAVESALEEAIGPRAREGTLGALRAMIAGDIARWKLMRTLRRRWGRDLQLDRSQLALVLRLVRREIKLAQQRRMLNATQRLFRLWHLVHQPFSITAFVAVAVHVIVVVALGVTWFW